MDNRSAEEAVHLMAVMEMWERDLRKMRRRSLLGPWRIRPLRWLASVNVEWKPQDLWVGAFWKTTPFDSFSGYDLYVCILPCLPIHIWWYRRTKQTSV